MSSIVTFHGRPRSLTTEKPSPNADWACAAAPPFAPSPLSMMPPNDVSE